MSKAAGSSNWDSQHVVHAHARLPFEETILTGTLPTLTPHKFTTGLVGHSSHLAGCAAHWELQDLLLQMFAARSQHQNPQPFAAALLAAPSGAVQLARTLKELKAMDSSVGPRKAGHAGGGGRAPLGQRYETRLRGRMTMSEFHWVVFSSHLSGPRGSWAPPKNQLIETVGAKHVYQSLIIESNLESKHVFIVLRCNVPLHVMRTPLAPCLFSTPDVVSRQVSKSLRCTPRAWRPQEGPACRPAWTAHIMNI